MRIRLAVVDDDEDFHLHLKFRLGKADDLEVVGWYYNGAEALAGIPKVQPQVVLMDVRMPGMSGLECTERLKALLPSLKIIILTGYLEEEKIVACVRAGANGCLYKFDRFLDYRKAIHEAMAGAAPCSGQLTEMLLNSIRQTSGHATSNEALSRCENQILKLVAQGLTEKEIAAASGTATATVHVHVKHIYEKLHVHSRGQAAANYWSQAGQQHPTNRATPRGNEPRQSL